MSVKVIKKADWVVAWDEGAQEHVYLQGADVAFDGTEILHVGFDYEGGEGELEELDGRGYLVAPGLVDVHSHLSHEPINKGYTDETGSPGLYNSNLFEYMPTMVGDQEAAPPQTRMAAAELLMSGVTTIVDMSRRHPEWIDVMVASGLRTYIAPMFRSAAWLTRNGHVVEYDWDEAAGEREMEHALNIVDTAEKHESGRIHGMVTPAQIDTCTPELIQASHRAAQERGTIWQIHAAQSVSEFHEITRRHGVTPIRWLHDLGVLGPGTIVGHGIFLDDHPSTRWSTTDDLQILADTGASVAHCPTVFWRRGMALQDFGRYLRAGVNMTVGTDTYPHNMIEELRHVGYLARLTGGSPRTVSTGQIFTAATIGASKALGRDDIGRLAKGCKADFFMADMRHPLMNPARDPIRSLVYAAADRAIRHVYVDGRQVVEDGRALSVDLESAALDVNEAQKRAEKLVPERDLVAGRSSEVMSPLSFEKK